MCQVEPDKFYSKDTYVVLYLSGIISRFNCKNESETNEKQAVLFELACIANALLCKSVTSFNQLKRITINVSIS